MSEDSPYLRVTDRQRFALLHEATPDLVTDLGRRFVVAVEEAEPEGAGGGLSALRLVPAVAGAAVTLTLTDFPGLHVRFGERHVDHYPRCGCDGCDEQPDDLLEDLREKLDSVAHGDVSEPSEGHDPVLEDGRASGGERQRLLTGRKATLPYDAWPRRS